MSVLFGKSIRESRRQRKLSQQQLADLIKVSRTAVALWESGQHVPSEENQQALAAVFNNSALVGSVRGGQGTRYQEKLQSSPTSLLELTNVCWRRDRVAIFGTAASRKPEFDFYISGDPVAYLNAQTLAALGARSGLLAPSGLQPLFENGDVVMLKELSRLGANQLVLLVGAKTDCGRPTIFGKLTDVQIDRLTLLHTVTRAERTITRNWCDAIFEIVNA